jgi:hypothetical protein
MISSFYLIKYLLFFKFHFMKNASKKQEWSSCAQDLVRAADVCIKSQHIDAPLWLTSVSVHGEAQ